VCRLYAEGMKIKDIAEFAKVDRGTVGDWMKRADVQTLVSKMIKERENAILRHIDTKIEAKLTGDGKHSMETLLKARREYAGRSDKLELTGDTASVMADFMKELHENPDLADALKKRFQEMPTDADLG
jgi:hypothetical protein